MAQLGIAGEIQWLNNSAGHPELEFRVTRPGRQYDIKADLAASRAKVEQVELNGWGALRTLHTFTGVRFNDARNGRDWILTTVWALAMDALAAGLIVITLSGVAIAWQSSGSRRLGALVLLAGTAACGWFVVGLRLFAHAP